MATQNQTAVSSPIIVTESLRSQPATRKVLHLINGEHFAGAERVQDLLAMSLPQFGYAADFACLKPGKFKEVRNSDTELFELTMRNSFDLFVAREVTNILKSNDYSMLHAHTPRTLMIGSLVARRLNIPFVYHVHSPVGRDSTRGLRNKINTWVETRCLQMVDAMICVSGSLRGYMLGIGHDADKLHVVRNGVPSAKSLPQRKRPEGTWTLGTMALYRPRKGIETLLESLKILKEQGVDVVLRAVGGFETEQYENEVKQLATSLGVENMITWTGFQTDINAQFQRMDCFVLPSLFGEGLPMVVLESMAQGVPVIASNVEGIPEAVRDGIDGLIFEAGSAKDLAAKVAGIVGDGQQWQEFRDNSIRRQRDELSDNSMAKGVAGVYESIKQRG